MEQMKLDSDDLFSEASEEIKDDVEEAIEDAKDSLPDIDEIMEVEGENIIGVLNGLKSDLSVDNGVEPIREARKWFEMGKRAESFDDEYIEEKQEELDDLIEIFDLIEKAEDNATDLTDSLANLKKHL